MNACTCSVRTKREKSRIILSVGMTGVIWGEWYNLIKIISISRLVAHDTMYMCTCHHVKIKGTSATINAYCIFSIFSPPWPKCNIHMYHVPCHDTLLKNKYISRKTS